MIMIWKVFHWSTKNMSLLINHYDDIYSLLEGDEN